MPKVIFNEGPGTVYTNTGTKVLWQFIVNWQNSCGVCSQYDHAISSYFPIPLHRSCRCQQRPVPPGHDALPFVDFMDEIDKLSPVQQSRVVGRSNLILIERGIVGWKDVVTPTRVRDFREVVSIKKLSVATMTRAGVQPRLASNAYATVHTPAHVLAEQQRTKLVANLQSKGISKPDIKAAFGKGIAARVSIKEGPSGPQSSPVKPFIPKSPTLDPAVAKHLGIKPPPKPKTVQEVRVADARRRVRALKPELAKWDAEVDRTKAEYRRLAADPKSDPGALSAARDAWIKADEGRDKFKTRLESLQSFPGRVKANPNLIPAGPIADRIKADDDGAKKVEKLAALGARTAEIADAMKSLQDRYDTLTKDYFAIKSPTDAQQAAYIDESGRLGAAIGNLGFDKLREKLRVRSRARKVLEAANPIEVRWDFGGGTVGGRDYDAADPAIVDNADSAADWLNGIVERGNAAGTFATKVGTIPPARDQRAHCTWDGQLMAHTPSDDVRTYVHEFGHAIDARLSDGPGRVLDRSLEFLEHRVGAEPVRKLLEVFPQSGYRPDELGRKDRFDDAFGDSAWYCGKDYGTNATEIFSMGLEMLYHDPAGFAAKDSEYCRYVVGILSGALR